ncbi:hypothetical protein Tco_0728813 [Tanacetum coccineum]|uniref:Uncharacterized protein n=1 Tax=Tanacetum coccineum TaxID=301880 RepID=A0ABQ4YN19_9ASTR
MALEAIQRKNRILPAKKENKTGSRSVQVHALCILDQAVHITYDGDIFFKAHEFCRRKVPMGKHTCFVRDSKGYIFLKGSHGTTCTRYRIDDLRSLLPDMLAVQSFPKSNSWLWRSSL